MTSPLCDWWLVSRRKCRHHATAVGHDEGGGPLYFCYQHWPLARIQYHFSLEPRPIDVVEEEARAGAGHMNITGEQFQSYEDVRQSGVYNMIMQASYAREAAGLSREEYQYILLHYRELRELFGTEEATSAS